MSEMVGVSRDCRHRNGALSGLLAALKLGLSRLTSRRSSQLRLEEWPDYLLRDVGLDRSIHEPADPRAAVTDWPVR